MSILQQQQAVNYLVNSETITIQDIKFTVSVNIEYVQRIEHSTCENFMANTKQLVIICLLLFVLNTIRKVIYEKFLKRILDQS